MTLRLSPLLALAFASTVFAGCTGGGGGGDAQANAIDSEVARVRALVEGREWNDAAQLMMLGTVESAMDASEFLQSTSDSSDPEAGMWGDEASRFFLEEFLPESDDDVGDGNAGSWFAVFRAPGVSPTYVVAVDHEGHAEGKEVEGEEDESAEMGPIGDYTIDSNMALQRASKKGGAAFLDAMNADDGGVFYALVGPMEGYEQQMPEGVWMVFAASAPEEGEESDDEDFSMIFVDAKTGAAYTMQDLFQLAFQG